MKTLDCNRLAYSAFVLLLTFASCEKPQQDDASQSVNYPEITQLINQNLEDNSLEAEYKIVNGVIHFKNPKTFMDYLQKTKNSSANLSTGFTSYHTIRESFWKEYNLVSTKTEYENVIEKYKRFLDLTHSVPDFKRISTPTIEGLLDENGLIYIRVVAIMNVN